MSLDMRRLLFAVVVAAALASDGRAAVMLGVDFQHNGIVDTQAGFQAMVITPGSQGATKSFGGGIQVSISAVNVVFLDTRHRSILTDGGSLTQSALLRDKVFAWDKQGLGGINRGLDVAITGLTAFQEYKLTVWSWDQLTGGQDNRASAWFVGTDTSPFIQYAFDATLPNSNESHSFMTTVTASGTGTVAFRGRRLDTSVNSGGGFDHGVFLNAFRLEAVPEPSAIAVWFVLSLGLIATHRRWRRSACLL